jgi:amino acid transporter
MSDPVKSKSTGTDTHPIHSLRSVNSEHAGVVNYINAKEAHNESELLAQIGYKEELNRNMTPLQVFGIAFSIMGLLPSISSVMLGGLMGGPATLLWGWFLGGIFIIGIGYCMSELASAIPTSGGLYYWTYHYAPPKWKALSSFVIGVSNSLALAGGVCSITYGLAVQILSAVYVNEDGNFEITNARCYGVFAAAVIVQLAVACLASGFVARLQSVSIIANNLLIVLFFIALPIGTKVNRGGFNDGSFIFGHFENLTDWTDGWAFFQMGIMPVVWTIGAFDSCVHMSEEARDPSRSVPRGILGSITGCWIVGFFIIVTINACMSSDLESIVNTPSGQPLTQIFYDSLGKRWAVAFISLTAVCQFLMGCSIMTAVSRQIWAFSRDDGFPFSSFVKVVNKKLSVPLRAVGASAVIALLIGLLVLIGSAASNALFSIAVIGNYVSWGTPQVLRFTSGRDVFQPGQFYHGAKISLIVNVISILFMVFVIILAMFPSSRSVDKKDMNYAVVINCGIWILSVVYFYAYKKKYYTGPKSNLDEDEYLDAVNGGSSNDNIDAVLEKV